MSGSTRQIDNARDNVLESLQSDLVSAQEFLQILRDEGLDSNPRGLPFRAVLQQLLEADVHVGSVRNCDGKYVHFVAWKGTVAERCSRAILGMCSTSEGVADYCFWLCLDRNVDSFEV
jgi:hypothetical protein